VPVLYEACEIPLRWRRLHYLDFTKDFNSGLERLLRDLNIEPPPPPIPNDSDQPGPDEPQLPRQPPKASKLKGFFLWVVSFALGSRFTRPGDSRLKRFLLRVVWPALLLYAIIIIVSNLNLTPQIPEQTFMRGFKRPVGVLEPRIILQASATPPTVAPGLPTRIRVTARDRNGSPLQGAHIEVRANGGVLFLTDRAGTKRTTLAPGPLSGVTDQAGSFTAWWQCDQCMYNHTLTVSAVKAGYGSTRTQFVVPITANGSKPPAGKRVIVPAR
jgi:hypothetical protein